MTARTLTKPAAVKPTRAKALPAKRSVGSESSVAEQASVMLDRIRRKSEALTVRINALVRRG